jgi:hypothetical protein
MKFFFLKKKKMEKVRKWVSVMVEMIIFLEDMVERRYDREKIW